jgi:hypothetical protein
VQEGFHLGLSLVSAEYYIDMTPQPGDHLVITSGLSRGRYIIESVQNDTTLSVPKPFTNSENNLSWYVERRFEDTTHSGPYVVRGFDPLTKKIGTHSQETTWQKDCEVLGSIMSGGLGDEYSLAFYWQR